MDKNEEQLNLLLLKIENLLLRQQDFEAEIKHLREEIRQIRSSSGSDAPIFAEKSIQQPTFLPKNTPPSFAKPIQPKPFAQPSFTDKFKRENLGKSDFEKFIGENLINKIGILILVIGVAIGAKYAIDHEMISPLTRIILGYAMGTGLMAFAIKLKTKYESFSAVLLSGAIAILYFITYAAYAYYALIPQALTFGLMVFFTSFTVVAAIKYNQQVIAHIGLVGAYGVPFLLSDGSGKVVTLFSYMAIINTGILVLAFKKYWKSLFYSSFTLSWIIFLAWRIPLEAHAGYFKISMLFSGIFFITFYITNLAYKISKKEQFQIIDIIILLFNSFIFYGIGYYALLQTPKGTEVLGLFTLGNAIIHFVVSLIIYKRKLADKNLFYFVLAMVITFITMAVPVQLNGNWVTIFWAIEAFILFYLGRKKHIAIYEKLSFPLIFLAFFSLLQDWALSSSEFSYLYDYTPHQPFLNVGFLSSCLCIASFLGMLMVNRQTKEEQTDGTTRSVRQVLTYCIPTILIITVYYTFRIEIANIFQDAYESTKINTTPSLKVGNYAYNENYPLFKTTWVYCYTLFFAAVLTYINLRKIKSKALAVANLVINVLVILAFLTQGLYVLSELREAYILQSDKYFSSSMTNIGIRYIALVFFAGLIIVCYQLSKSDLFKLKFRTAFDYLLYIAILWVLSSELLQLLQLNGLENGYKLGLSILWGVYSLFLISMGLWKNKKYLRVGAIILFGITLIKLCFYDLSSLGTISRTIVFISLGILLLIISFLYNKYKHLINDDVKAKN